VPSLWRVEFANALINAERRSRMTRERRRAVLAHAEHLPLRVDVEQASLSVLSDIADAHSLTAYDAISFELALRRKLPLATLDTALVKAARAARLVVLTDSSLYPEK
jgi:predicted nucleic acid-binding protein